MKQMTPRTDACHEGRRELYLGGTVDYAFAAQLETELNETKAALEREQMRLVACDVIALADTPTSAADARKMHPDYESAALVSVIRRVDECIALRQMVRELRDALDVSLIRAYTSGYRHGHEATVEAQYFDIHSTDESSYFRDDIRQMVFDGALPEAEVATAKANQLLQ